MLRITVDGKDVDTSEDISIDMKITNPLFSESGFDELYSYRFTVPKTPRNKGIFNRGNGKKHQIRVLYSNHVIAEGKGIIKEGYDIISIDFKNESLDMRQSLDELPLSQIEFETIQIYEPADHPNTKISKWKDHMTATTITASENEGSHKFPWIQANYQLNQDDELWLRNQMHSDNNFFINGYLEGEYQFNIGENASGEGEALWLQTVSPCPRIEHIFDKIIEHMGIIITENELLEVPEFRQMFHFSTLVMDELQVHATLGIDLKYNVHGKEINLNTFIPDLMAGNIFQVLNTLFGIVVFVKGSKFKIQLKKTLFNKKPVDFSKYCDNKYEVDLNDRVSIKYIYPIDYTEKDVFGSPKWSYVTDTSIGGFVWKTFNKHETRKLGGGNTINEIEVSYTPLISIFDYNYITTDRQSRFVYPYNFISSHYDVEDYTGSPELIIGLIRGIYPIKEGGTFYDRLVFENSFMFDDIAPRVGHEYRFGTCSIYLKDASSHLDIYLNKYLASIYRGDEITKILYLPMHVILKIMTWQEPNHIIKQRNLSFKGTVKEINFTLYKNGISACTVKYAVVDPEKVGDFNNDYNDDFLI